MFAAIYFALLAVQTRGVFALGRRPTPIRSVLALALRQMVCLLGPILALFLFGEAWLACLVSLFLGRHWILVVAWPTTPAGLVPQRASA
ncbi:MAG: hypothetical protein VKP62_12115 [Candidatus Sericytochromatia bacterium]|nr:hypothetical protein [Candidatus Sericytochromatia bacterium]